MKETIKEFLQLVIIGGLLLLFAKVFLIITSFLTPFILGAIVIILMVTILYLEIK